MVRTVALLLALALVAIAGPSEVAAAPKAERWIVQLRPGTDVAGFVVPAERQLGLRPTNVFQRVMRGFSATLTPGQRAALLSDPRVQSIQPDLPTQVTADTVPPGVSRVGANPSAVHSPTGTDPTLDVDIAILDTGVEQSHPDLRVVGGRNCTDTTAGWARDIHGHGTHVAGIAAARDNGSGIIGVAPGARIWSVKVLNNKGNGYASWLICGLDWVASRADPANPSLPRIEVANMSLRMSGADDGNCGLTNNDLVHQAVCRLDRTGVTVVAAAGNDSRNAANYAPAAYEEVITVSALADYDGLPGGNGTRPAECPRNDADDAFAAFSNFGPDVDLIAPGVCVYSTHKGGGYTLMSGTSMAAPHVAAGVALYHLYELSSGRTRPTPQQARAALTAAGSMNWKTSTDPDGKPEPLLDVSSLALAPSFDVGATPATQTRSFGDTATVDVWLARLGGFTGAVDIGVSGLPGGSSWNLGGDAFAAAESGWRRVSISLPTSGSPGTFNVQISATSDGQPERSTTAKLHLVGGVVNAAAAPRMLLRSGVKSKAVAVPVRIKWAKVSGAQRYRLEVSRDGGAWTEVVLPSKTATKVDTTAWPGSTYRYRLQVRKSGAWGSWLLGPPTRVTPRYAGEAVALSGAWVTYSHAQAYSEIPAYSRQAGARATLDFTGRSVSWITSRGPKRGKARVFIDGVLAAKVDLYASRLQHRRVVFSKSWSSAGAHRIVVEVRGTSGRPRVDLDAILVVSTD